MSAWDENADDLRLSVEETMLRKVRAMRRPKKSPAIVGFACSDIGVSLTNADMLAVYRKRAYPHASEETQKLYEKLLGRQPDRSRNFFIHIDEIAGRHDLDTKFKRFKEVSLAWIKDAGEKVLRENGYRPEDIDYLVVNYMAGKTLPSLAGLAAHALGLRSDIDALAIGDMGCAAAVAALDVTKKLLKAEPKPKRALILSLEPVSNLFNFSDSPGTVVGNTLFGEGCAAVVVSTYDEPVLYHIGPSQRILKADDAGVDAIRLESGESGPAIELSRTIPEVAGGAVKENLKKLVPRIIEPSDKIKYLLTKKTPRWQARVDRWAIHPGGRTVLRGMERSLRLATADLGPSYRVFQERSNMSSPSVIYALRNIERAAVKAGERVLMMSFGSGFQVNSVVLTRGKKASSETPELNAVVIGGTSGIGLDAARMLVKRGYRVFVGSRRVGQGDDFEKLPGVVYLPLDVTSGDSVAAFTEQVWKATFGIDVMVVSSGVSHDATPVGRHDEEALTRTVETNLTGAMRVVNATLPHMRQRGHVILLNSILGQIPLMGSAIYCATKAGLKQFGESVEMELRRSGRKVAVHNLFPAYVKTPMLEQVKGSSRPLLKPIEASKVTASIEAILDGRASSGDGFVLHRDRMIAGLYRYLPGVFKRLATMM
jgi:predicted naringenin-chalcone synthase/NAD(P)-dependent dehydrogenase (short-subunit alcohol dehydrogenase family)